MKDEEGEKIVTPSTKIVKENIEKTNDEGSPTGVTELEMNEDLIVNETNDLPSPSRLLMEDESQLNVADLLSLGNMDSKENDSLSKLALEDELDNKTNDKTNDKSDDKTNDKTNDKSNDKSNDKTNDKSNDKTNDKSNDKSDLLTFEIKDNSNINEETKEIKNKSESNTVEEKTNIDLLDLEEYEPKHPPSFSGDEVDPSTPKQKTIDNDNLENQDVESNPSTPEELTFIESVTEKQNPFHSPLYKQHEANMKEDNDLLSMPTLTTPTLPTKMSPILQKVVEDSDDSELPTKDEITEAIRLNVQGAELLSRGRNDEAKYVFTVALRIAKRDLMDVKKAIRLAEKKSALNRGTPEETSPTSEDPKKLRAKRTTIASTIADTLNNLGVVHEINNNYDDALKSCREALRVYREMCGRNVGGIGMKMEDKSTELNNDLSRDSDPEVERTILNIGLMERAKDSYSNRMSLHSQAEERLRLVEDNYGNIHHNVAATTGKLTSNHKKSLLVEALNIYVDAYHLEKDQLGISHPSTARTLQLIGNIRWRLIHDYGAKEFRKEDATRDLSQAAQSLEISLGPVHPHVATSYLDLAALKDSMGETDEALDLYKRALDSQTACLGRTHPDVATTLNNIGVIYYSKNEHELALQAYDQASTIYASLDTFQDNPHPDASLVWNNVGELHKQIGNWDLASQAFEQSLNILKKSNMSDDAVLASTMLSAGEVYVKNNKCDKALIMFQRAYAIQCNIDSKLDLVTTLENIGDVREIKCQFQNALQCFFVSLKIRRQELGDDHVNNAITLLKIGTLHGKMHRPQEAFIFLNESLRIFHMNGLTNEHPRVKEAQRKRNGAKMSFPNYSQAAARSSRTKEEINEECGEVYALDAIAGSMMKRCNWDGAMGTFQNALKLRRETLGFTHPDVGITLSNIAYIHTKKDELEEAVILFQEALRLCELNGMGKGHPHFDKIRSELDTLTERGNKVYSYSIF